MTGGMGVLLFFFLSGYGLFKGYGGKQLGISFWRKRLVNMYLPCVLIQLIFCVIDIIRNQDFELWGIVAYSLFGMWFIDVILVQYFIFYIAWILTKGKANCWILLSFLFSMVAVYIFWKLKFNARWYNGLMLFPFGMLAAYKEKKLIALVERKWGINLVVVVVLFVLSGAAFTCFKEAAVGINIIKTFSGMCLSMMMCIVFLRVKLCSKIMRYMGKRSLYFYLIHLNLLTELNSSGFANAICSFYLVILLTFSFSGLLCRMYGRMVEVMIKERNKLLG